MEAFKERERAGKELKKPVASQGVYSNVENRKCGNKNNVEEERDPCLRTDLMKPTSRTQTKIIIKNGHKHSPFLTPRQ